MNILIATKPTLTSLATLQALALLLLGYMPISQAEEQRFNIDRVIDMSNPYQSHRDEYSQMDEEPTDKEFFNNIARFDRFENCQTELISFMALAASSNSMSKYMSKDEWFASISSSEGIDYPFSTYDAEYHLSRITQLSITVFL